jgi:hypothetical protein
MLSHQLDMSAMQERMSVMERLLLQHKIKPPPPCKNTESRQQVNTRVNKRKLVAVRKLERLQTDGIEVKFTLSPPTSKSIPAVFDLDLLECIAPFLDFKSLGRLRQVNRQWRSTFYNASIMKVILSTTDYISMYDVYAMVANTAGGNFTFDVRSLSVDGIAVVRGRDVLHLLHKHGASWEKMAREHSAQTAIRLAFQEIPIPHYVIGKRRDQEVLRCSVCM